jgi:hypothetical protein
MRRRHLLAGTVATPALAAGASAVATATRGAVRVAVDEGSRSSPDCRARPGA